MSKIAKNRVKKIFAYFVFTGFIISPVMCAIVLILYELGVIDRTILLVMFSISFSSFMIFIYLAIHFAEKSENAISGFLIVSFFLIALILLLIGQLIDNVGMMAMSIMFLVGIIVGLLYIIGGLRRAFKKRKP